MGGTQPFAHSITSIPLKPSFISDNMVNKTKRGIIYTN